MNRTSLAAIALATSTLAASSCGSTTKPTNQTTTSPISTQTPASNTTSSKPTGPLTRAQLIADGDTICYRLNTRRSTTRVARPQDYKRLIPALAAYELAGANEMNNLTPPPSMAHDWQQMITGARDIARATAKVHNYADANNTAISRTVERILYKGIHQLTTAAKRAGFKDCAHIP